VSGEPASPAQDGFAAIERHFRRRVARDRDRLVDLWQAVAAVPGAEVPAADRRLVILGDIAHGLVGTGGTFGFPALSEAASPLEALVDARSRDRAALAAAVAALIAAMAPVALAELPLQPASIEATSCR
jgi:chemotaxis protein histidine kinase CheA